jgi:hypothetical protein
MEAYDGVDALIHIFLIPVLIGEFSASGLGLFNPGESSPYS